MRLGSENINAAMLARKLALIAIIPTNLPYDQKKQIELRDNLNQNAENSMTTWP